jgi:steroid delta-isomerase-like uncharacterized protein
VSSNEEKRRVLRQVFEEIWSKGNLELVAAIYSPGYVFHTPAEPEPIRGREAWKEFIERIRSGFPDVQVTVEDVLADGDLAAARTTMRMTHTGEYQGLPPTGTRLEASQTVFARFEDGRIVEGWQEIDALGVMRQLGVVPPAGVGPVGLIGWTFRTIGRIAALTMRARRRG